MTATSTSHSSQSLIDEARAHAEQMLPANGSELGLLVGGGGAYRQVWARDSMICGLALMLLDKGQDIHRRSLATLEQFQSPLGNIPHNVGFPNLQDAALLAFGGTHGSGESPLAEPVRDTAHAGCIDNSLWFNLGQFVHWGHRAWQAWALNSVSSRPCTGPASPPTRHGGTMEVHNGTIRLQWSNSSDLSRPTTWQCLQASGYRQKRCDTISRRPGGAGPGPWASTRGS